MASWERRRRRGANYLKTLKNNHNTSYNNMDSKMRNVIPKLIEYMDNNVIYTNLNDNEKMYVREMIIKYIYTAKTFNINDVKKVFRCCS